MKTLNEVSKALKISLKKASEIKRKIENEYGCPSYMIWGTGNKKKYTLSSFEKYL